MCHCKKQSKMTETKHQIKIDYIHIFHIDEDQKNSKITYLIEKGEETKVKYTQ